MQDYLVKKTQINNNGSKIFIVISLVLFLVIAFAVGITLFRQTKSIWTMTITNAITINNTLNTFPIIEHVLLIIIAIVAIVCLGTVNKGFG